MPRDKPLEKNFLGFIFCRDRRRGRPSLPAGRLMAVVGFGMDLFFLCCGLCGPLRDGRAFRRKIFRSGQGREMEVLHILGFNFAGDAGTNFV